MTLQEIIQMKQQTGYTNEMISKESGVPLGTVQKVLGGTTKSPRRATLEALSRVFAPFTKSQSRLAGDITSEYFRTEALGTPPAASCFREEAAAYSASVRPHTIEDIYALPDGVRAELIDGQLYYMATPSRTHQKINGEMHLAVANFIRAHGGQCEVYIPPFAVFLYGDESTYLEPDLTVVCDPAKLEERGCIGAPDWVVEILSPSSSGLDCTKKLINYRDAGVREYWIISPEKRIIIVYVFADKKERERTAIYSFDDTVPCSLWADFSIQLADHV